MNFKNNVIILSLWLCALVLSLNLSAAKIPTLAIINKHKDKTLADLLFVELAKEDKINLVEREKIKLILKEQELSSAAKDSNIKLGKLLKADGLLFIKPVDSQLFKLQLVETNRGEIINSSLLKNKNIEEQLKLFDTRLTKLSVPPEKRKYIALSPGIQEDTRKNDLLLKFTALVGNLLFNQKNIIIVDRMYLPDVMHEKMIGKKNTNDLSVSDFIIRGQITSLNKDTNECNLEIQLQSVADHNKQTFKVSFDNFNLSEKAKNTAQKLLLKIDSKTKFNETNLNQEAKLFHTNGLIYSYQKNYDKAHKYLKIAFLLNNKDSEMKADYVKAVFQYIKKETRFVYGRLYLLKPELMKQVRLLDQALNVMLSSIKEIKNREKSWNQAVWLIYEEQPYQFLSLNLQDLSLEEKNEMIACQAKIRKLFEESGKSKNKYCSQMAWQKFLEGAPYLYHKPEDLVAFYCRNLSNPYFNPECFYNNPFIRINYANRKVAEKAWMDLLDEVFKQDSIACKFYALFAKCDYYHAGYRYKENLSKSKAKKAAFALFKWLNSSPKHIEWVVKNAKRASASIFYPLPMLDLRDQDYYFRKVAGKVIWGYPYFINSSGFGYLNDRYQLNVIKKKNPDDVKNIIDLGNFLLNEVKKKDPKRVKKILESHKWFTDLTGQKPAYDPWMNPKNIDDKFIIFDSNKIFNNNNKKRQAYFGSGNPVFLDGDILWLGWQQPGNSIGIARVNLKTKKEKNFNINMTSKLKKIHTFYSLMTKMNGFLCIIDGSNLFAIPTSPKAPYLKMNETIQLAKISGLPELKGEWPQKYNISALIPGKDFLFIGIDQPPGSSGDSGNFGGIAKWNLKTNKAEMICSSKSLKNGPLNDCLPYTVLAGCQNKAGNKAYFFIQGYARSATTQKKDQMTGIYRFNISDSSWKKISDRCFGVQQNKYLPRLPKKDIFEFSTTLKRYFFDMNQETMSSVCIPIPDPANPQQGWLQRYNSHSDYYEVCKINATFCEDRKWGASTIYGKEPDSTIVKIHSEYFLFNKIIPYKDSLILMIYNSTVSPSYRCIGYLIHKDYQSKELTQQNENKK